MGSLLGLGWLLRDQGKDITMACQDLVPDVYRWLPGSAEIVAQGQGSFDLVISLDCSDPRRLGQAWNPTRSAHEPGHDATGVALINIDHHVTNTAFGTINWIDPGSVATTQMILTLADASGWPLSKTVAICLLNGLVTDTRSFRTPNVDIAAVRSALRLMEAGASLKEIVQRALEQRPLASVRLWGDAIGRAELQDGILWTEVTRGMRQQWDLEKDGDSGLANFLSGVREAQVVAVFSERDNGTIDVGLRAVPGYDVSEVALRLGGGGHPQAAGCTLEGELEDVKQRVLTELRQDRLPHGQVATAAGDRPTVPPVPGEE
jgi:phosphoesterase RecJ-like protein